MTKIFPFFTLIMVVASLAMTDETFNGIGITFYSTPDGARIVDVVPGTPAAKAQLQKGCTIIAVDGESIKGEDSQIIKAKLRGSNNQPVELTYLNSGDTLVTVLRRSEIILRKVANAEAASKVDGRQLIALLNDGVLFTEENQKGSLVGVYIKEDLKKNPSTPVEKSTNFYFKSFSRNTLDVEVDSDGFIEVFLINVDGSVVASIEKTFAKKGGLSMLWNLEKVPSGKYTLAVKYNGRLFGKNVTLK